MAKSEPERVCSHVWTDSRGHSVCGLCGICEHAVGRVCSAEGCGNVAANDADLCLPHIMAGRVSS